MAAISDKLTYLLGTKAAIKTAIEAKGVTVSESATFRSYATSIEQITGGDEPATGDYKVYFYDYYGKLVKISYVNSGEDATPPTLTDANLTFVEWQGDSYTNVTSDRKCYAIGVTTDGKWHFDIELTPVTGLQPPLYFINTNDGNSLFIDLGDGSPVVEITATGNITHTPTYATYGKYTIKAWKTTGTFGLGNGTSATTVVGGDVSNYRSALTAVRGGNGVTGINDYAFGGARSITSITFSDSITSIGNGVLGTCYSLTSAIIPDGVTSIGELAFNFCYSLTSAIIPDSVTSIGASAFTRCTSLASITIPDSVANIGNTTFDACYRLTSITIPYSVTNIGTNAFRYCYSITKYIINATTPPTLASTNAFTGINSICKIYVPDASVTAYKTATNWVTYADYIYPISELED